MKLSTSINNCEKTSGCLKFIIFNWYLNINNYKCMLQPLRYGYKQFTVGQCSLVASHAQPSIIWTDKKERKSRK